MLEPVHGHIGVCRHPGDHSSWLRDGASSLRVGGFYRFGIVVDGRVGDELLDHEVERSAFLRKALILSFTFLPVAWFFGSWVGLAAGLFAVAVWWGTSRPRIILWPAAVGSLAAAPIATWLQGLPDSSVVGADFGVRHWLANDMVIASLIVATFASLVELLHLEIERQDRGPLEKLGKVISDLTRGRVDGERTGRSPEQLPLIGEPSSPSSRSPAEPRGDQDAEDEYER
jgi:hypothetical protein